MDAQRVKRRRDYWRRWGVFLILLVLIFGGAVLWIVENQGPWISILPVVIFSVLGTIIALFQWLFPVTSDSSSHSVVTHHILTGQQPQPTVPSSTGNSSLPHTNAGLLADIAISASASSYRKLIGVPPPTDARTVQQRDKAVQEIYERLTLDDTAAIALTGIGGVGKSMLAALVYRYAENQRLEGKGPFATEALWLKVDSTAVTMNDLAGTIFESLGMPLPDLSNLAPHNLAALLMRMLNTTAQPCLIVIDQFENLLDWQTGYALSGSLGVGEWLDAVNSQPCACRILLTSRPWPQGTRGYPPTYMQEYHVKGLEVTEGMALLKKLGLKATDDELYQATERCAGHAFALTLLASLLRNRHMSLTTFFKDPAYTKLWTGNVARNLLDSIYVQQLNPCQRQLLPAFSVYREPVPLEAVLVVADMQDDLPQMQIQQDLDALLTQHLVQPVGEGLYQLHTVVIGFANDRFDIHSEAANLQALKTAHARAARYYLQYAAKHCLRRGQRRQRSDVQPLVEAVWHLCQADKWQEAYTLLEQEELYSDLRRWGYSAVLLELYQLLVPPTKWSASSSEASHLYNNLGEVYRILGQPDRARQCFEQALQLSKEGHDSSEEGRSLNNLGRSYADVGNKRQALSYYEEALVVYRDRGGNEGAGAVLTNMGWVYYDFSLMEKAREKYEEALSMYRVIQDHNGEAAALNAIGRVYAAQDNIEKALIYHVQALEIYLEMGDRSGEAWTRNNLGRIYGTLGDVPRATDYFHQALAIRREIGNRGGEASTLNNLGILYATLNQYEQAEKSFKEALILRREVGNRAGEAKTLYCLGRLYGEMEQYEQAEICFKQALKIRRELGQTQYEAQVLNRLGMWHKANGNSEQALACWLRAEELFEALQAQDLDAEQRLERVRDHIDELQKFLGDEEFAALRTRVQPDRHQIVENAVQL